MKTTLSVLERAEDALMKALVKVSHLTYIRELEALCRSCGWSLPEYQRASLAFIDANWEPNVSSQNHQN